MKADIESIKRSKNIYIFSDKTNNLYGTDIKNYNKLLVNNISKTYILERVDYFGKSNAFVTLKDHKENFQSNPKCRLINPAKSEISKVSKFFIEKINTKVREFHL